MVYRHGGEEGREAQRRGYDPFQLAKTGIGNTYADSWMETYTEDCYKDEYKFATEGADYWTDASGNRYIFN